MDSNMSMITFSADPKDELYSLYEDLRLSRLAEHLKGDEIPEDVLEDLKRSTAVLADIFGNSLPAINEGDFAGSLRTAARDINLSAIFRERGLFRLYRVLRSTHKVLDMDRGWVDVPVYATQINPDTGECFTRQEDFLRWFCTAAGIGRATVFMRMATIDRLLALSMTLEEAYQALLNRPYAVREALKMVSTWEGPNLVAISPAVGRNLADKLLPAAQADEVKQLIDLVENTEAPMEDRVEAQEQLLVAIKPALKNLVQEVTAHDSLRGAMDFVRFDLAARPEIKYLWSTDKDGLIVELIRREVVGGTAYETETVRVLLVPEKGGELPPEIRQDLLQRLPIKNMP